MDDEKTKATAIQKHSETSPRNLFDGMSAEGSIRLLATEIEAISPPIRSWEWIAEWMESQGIVGRDGKPIHWEVLQSAMCRLRKNDVPDVLKANRLRRKLLETSFAAADIDKLLQEEISADESGEPLAAAKRNLLRRGSLEIRGLTVRQALARLANSISVIKPPLRSWDWIANWLVREGARPEDGKSPITAKSVGESWRRGLDEFQSKGLADSSRADLIRERIRGELISEKEIGQILLEFSKTRGKPGEANLSGEDARLLRDALGTVKGMSIEQAILRVSKPIAILKPPVREWKWVADWMRQQGVGARAGVSPTGQSLAVAWSMAKSKGMIDESHAATMRKRIMDSPIGDQEAKAILTGKATAPLTIASGASFEPEASLLSNWLESPKGQFMSQASLRLANAIAFARPPLRSWDWVAGWLDEHGVVNRKGGQVHGKRIRSLFSELAADGRVDPSDADLARQPLLSSGISDGDLKAILETRIGPARLDRLQPPKRKKGNGP